MHRIPRWAQALYPVCQWQVRSGALALTFDDGPHPESTPLLMALLGRAGIPVTHFLLGRQVEKYPELFHSIKESGHVIGHHSYSHMDGWKTKDDVYLDDVLKGQRLTGTNLFRPPYGKITHRKWRLLKAALPDVSMKMFNRMPGDFDPNVSSGQLHQRMKEARGGDIIVLHDTPDAFSRYAPFLLEWIDEMKNRGLEFVSLQHE